MSNFSSNESESCYLARTLKTKRGKMHSWSMMNDHHHHHHHHPPPPPSHSVSDFSTPRNQRLGMAYIENNNNTSFSDIDEWLEHANKFCKTFNQNLAETRGNEQEYCRMSAEYSNFITAQERELYNIILPSVREESPLPQHITSSCINLHGGSSSSRPKPFDELLYETRRNKNLEEVDRGAPRNKAKHLQLMHRLRRKEEAINDWELYQTRKAMDHMDKIQNELERKQIMASAKTQKKICSVRDKAEKQKLNLRRSTMKKFRQLHINDTQSPSDTPWNSHLPLC